MSPVRALLQSMPPLFGPESDLDQHLQDLDAPEATPAPLDALLLASVEEGLLLPVGEQPDARTDTVVKTPVTPEKLPSTPDPQLDSVRPITTIAVAASGSAVLARPVELAGATGSAEIAIAPADIVQGQLTSHRVDLASVDLKLASLDGDIDRTKSQASQINDTLKLHLAQRACLLTLRKAHAQFISRCAKTA